MKPEISIIVPYYNTEKYISKCIKSILEQTFDNFELILVDDGSTDDSYRICKSFSARDNRIILIRKKNEGQGVARNMGLDCARGNFIGFVDSDDYINPEMFEILHDKIIEYSADLSICGYNIFYNPNGKMRSGTKIHTEIIYDNQTLMKTYVSGTLISGGPCNKLYKKQLFSNLRFPPLKMREDSFLMPHIISKVDRAIFVGKNLYNQYIRKGSTERSLFTINQMDALESVKSLENIILSDYSNLYKYVAFRRSRTRIDLMARIIKSGQLKNNVKIYNQLIEDLRSDLVDIKQYIDDEQNSYKEIILATKYNTLFKIKCSIGKLKDYLMEIVQRNPLMNIRQFNRFASGLPGYRQA